MIPTFFHFRHEASLREKRLVFEGGEKPSEPVEAAPAPEPNQQEVQSPVFTKERPEVFAAEIETVVADKKQETQTAVQKQFDTANGHEQRVDAILGDAGTTRESVGMPPAQAPEKTEQMDPALTAEVQKLPEEVRSPVLQILDGMDDAKKVEMKEFLGKIATVDPQVLKGAFLLPAVGDNGAFKTIDELTATRNAIPAGTAENDLAIQGYDFLIGLTPSERGFVEKIVRTGKELHEKIANTPASPESQAKINGYQERWKNATIQEERDLAEGFMLMEGAEIDAEGNVTMMPPENRFVGLLMGLVKVITALFGKLSGKKTAIQKQADELADGTKKEKAPADKLSPEERAKEITEIETDLKKSEETKVGLEKEIKAIEDEMLTATEEAKPELQKKLDNIKKQLVELEAAIALKTARLEELKNVIGQTESATESSEDSLLDAAKTNYLVGEGNAGSHVAKDIEYRSMPSDKEHGYIPYLKALLEEVKDYNDTRDEQLKETAILQRTAQAAQENLHVLASALDAANNKTSPAYESLRKLYCEKSTQLAELVGNVDEEFKNMDLLNTTMATEQTKATLARMTIDEAIGWVEKMATKIDDNHSQSNELKETYRQIFSVCESSLGEKLAQEKTASANNPDLRKAYVEHRRIIEETIPWKRYLS